MGKSCRFFIHVLFLVVALAPSETRGQGCDINGGVWLERQAYTSTAGLMLGLGGCVRQATAITPLQVSNDTLRLINGSVIGYVLTWNGTIWIPAAPAGSDNWGTQVVQRDSSLQGNGTTASPLGIKGYGAASTGQVPSKSTGGITWIDVGASTTDLSYSGTSSPVTLNSSTGTDVTVTAGAGIAFSATSSNLTIQADTSLLATLNDINAARNRDDSTFARLPGELYHTKRISSSAYRYGTTGFRTTDTTGVVNALSAIGSKPGVYVIGTTATGIHFYKAQASGYTGLSNFGAFTTNGQVFAGVNEPYSSRPNYVFNLGYNWATNATNEVANEQSVGLGFETYYQSAALSGGSTGFSEFHIRTRDTFGTEHRFFSAVEPWDAQRGKAQLTLTTDLFTFLDHAGSPVYQHNPLSNLLAFGDTTTMRFDEQFGFGLQVYNGTNYSNLLGFNGVNEFEIGRQNTDGVRITPPTMIGISATPARKLEVRGDVRITDLTTDTPTAIVGADADGDLGTITTGSGISLSGGVLSATGSGGTVTGTGAPGRVAYWDNVSNITGDANLTWSGTALGVTGLITHNVASSVSANTNFFNQSGTITSTANSVTNRAFYIQPDFSNDGTRTNQFYTGAGFAVTSGGSTSATQVLGINASATNTSPNVSQLYGMSSRVDENSPSGSLSNRYGHDILVVKGAQDATDAHTGTGIRVRLQESTASGRWSTGVGASIGVENALTGTGAAISVSNAKGTNAAQFGMTITNTATGSGVTVANAYGIRFIPTETSSGSITNNYNLFNNTAPVATNSWFLYNSQDYRNYLNGNLAIGVDVTTAKLFVRGSGSTSATTSFQLEKQDGTDYLVAKDDGKVGIGNNTTLARELHVTGEVRITDLTTDPPTQIVGADADGDLGAMALTNELVITSGTLGTNFSTTISPAELTAGTTNNWNPTGLATAWIIRLSGDDGFELVTGITAPSFNKRLTLTNVGANAVLFPTENQSSSAANRFAFGRDLILFPGKSAEIQYDVTSSRWRLLSQGGLYDDVQHIYMNQAINAPISGINGDYSFFEITSEGGISGIAPVAGRWAGLGVNTGSSASGLGYVASKDVFFNVNNSSGTATWAYEKAVIRTPSSLSDGSNDYTIRVGFNTSAGGSGATNGMYFNYNHGLSSGQWACHTTSGGNTQSNASGITVAASTVYVLEVVFRTNLSVEFFINGTRVATNDTFIPTGNNMICMAEIQKSVGTTSREMSVYTEQTSIGLVK